MYSSGGDRILREKDRGAGFCSNEGQKELDLLGFQSSLQLFFFFCCIFYFFLSIFRVCLKCVGSERKNNRDS